MDGASDKRLMIAQFKIQHKLIRKRIRNFNRYFRS